MSRSFTQNCFLNALLGIVEVNEQALVNLFQMGAVQTNVVVVLK